VLAPGQEPEHAAGILRVARLAQDRLSEHDKRVRAEDPSARAARSDLAGFRFRQARRGPGGFLSRPERLVDVGGLDLERNPERAQDLEASGRGGVESVTSDQ
jgi:hypothetical protein